MNENGINITLDCYEKEELYCHRNYVKRICGQELFKIKTKFENQNKDNKDRITDFIN